MEAFDNSGEQFLAFTKSDNERRNNSLFANLTIRYVMHIFYYVVSYQMWYYVCITWYYYQLYYDCIMSPVLCCILFRRSLPVSVLASRTSASTRIHLHIGTGIFACVYPDTSVYWHRHTRISLSKRKSLTNVSWGTPSLSTKSLQESKLGKQVHDKKHGQDRNIIWK